MPNVTNRKIQLITVIKFDPDEKLRAIARFWRRQHFAFAMNIVYNSRSDIEK